MGLGYWGPNYARILGGELQSTRLIACADRQADRLGEIAKRFPGVVTLADHSELLRLEEVEAVVVATPASTHKAIAEDCLRAGKHVLVEKPMATTSADAKSMADAAREVGRTLMVGHTFLFNPAVELIRRYLKEGLLGRLYYLYFHRTGLGPVRQDVNALWDLAPHDLSMLHYWLDAEPDQVSAFGQSYLHEACEDVAFVTLAYPKNVIANVHVSWLDPVKTRRVTVVGDRAMIVFDDTQPVEKIRVYDRGVTYQPTGGDYATFLASIHDGDITIPSLPRREPLKDQLLHFVECAMNGKQPKSDADMGVAVVRTIERAQEALRRRG